MSILVAILYKLGFEVVKDSLSAIIKETIKKLIAQKCPTKFKVLLRRVFGKKRKSKKVKLPNVNFDHTSDVFDWKIAEYLPGKRGLIHIDCSLKSAQLLEQFFTPPFPTFQVECPILFWGNKTEEIQSCQRLISNYVLINNRIRLKIKQVWFYRSDRKCNNFIYIEVNPDKVFKPKSTPNSMGEIEFGIKDKYIGNYRYMKLISREEYDDTRGAQLRICMTKSNNYLIFPKDSIFNIQGQEMDDVISNKMTEILNGHLSVENFSVFMQELADKHQNDLEHTRLVLTQKKYF